MNQKFLNTTGWVIGIILFITLNMGLSYIIESFGVVTYIDFGEEVCTTKGVGQTSYEDCSDGTSTDIGLAIMFLSAMLAGYIGTAIAVQKKYIFKQEDSKIMYLTILKCLVAYIIVASIILQFDLYWLSVIALVAIGYWGYTYYEKERNNY